MLSERRPSPPAGFKAFPAPQALPVAHDSSLSSLNVHASRQGLQGAALRGQRVMSISTIQIGPHGLLEHPHPGPLRNPVSRTGHAK